TPICSASSVWLILRWIRKTRILDPTIASSGSGTLVGIINLPPLLTYCGSLAQLYARCVGLEEIFLLIKGAVLENKPAFRVDRPGRRLMGRPREKGLQPKPALV